MNYTKYSFCIIASEMRRRRGKAAHIFLGQLPAPPSPFPRSNALQRVARNSPLREIRAQRGYKMNVLYGRAPFRRSHRVSVRFYILFDFIGACFLFRLSFLFLVEKVDNACRIC